MLEEATPRKFVRDIAHISGVIKITLSKILKHNNNKKLMLLMAPKRYYLQKGRNFSIY